VKRTPKVGDTGSQTFDVREAHVIDIAGDAELAVLSTPSLIWFLEHAARDALTNILDSSETSVGVSVEVEHLAATPRGHHVTCRARIVHIDGKLITFQVTAEDQQEAIARGIHKRRVVGTNRFLAHVRRKRADG
jgi:predicted thioesterase